MRVEFNPVAFEVLGLSVHWYGIMYLIGFTLAWALGRYRAGLPNSGWKKQEVDDWIFYVGLGVILGGRLGYILFYDFGAFIDNPLRLFMIWKGGMSFHGGLIGVMVAIWFFNRKFKKGYFNIVDFSAPLVPLALGAGRIGNFINGELWGAPTDVPWAMVFPVKDELLRHPTPLYEALLEGLVLFIILWIYSSKPRPTMAVSGVFAIGYSIFRIMVEFVRIPDAHIGYLAFGWLTMGMVLSLPLLAVGIFLLFRAYLNR